MADNKNVVDKKKVAESATIPTCMVCGAKLAHDGGEYAPLYKAVKYSYSCSGRACKARHVVQHTAVGVPGSNYVKANLLAPLKTAIKSKVPVKIAYSLD